MRVQATLYIELSRHGVIDAGGDRDGVHGVKIDEKDVVRHVVEGGVFQHFDLFLRVGDLGLVENDGFAVLEDAVVHVVHVRLTIVDPVGPGEGDDREDDVDESVARCAGDEFHVHVCFCLLL